MVYIGIDLGTTYSCVAIIENGKPKIIFNEEGENFTPSIVSYGDNEIVIGNRALEYPDLSRVLYDSKRLLGWEFMYRLPIAENRLLWTFDLDARNESVGYVLNRGTAEEQFISPEEVSADILRKLKLIAEKYTGEPITGAVVAIPAFFQTAQIEATKRAVQMAGLELKMLVKEPIAAAIAYNEDRKLEDSNIMIFDFGGGTLDINICQIKNGKLAIKAVHGDDHLGGHDFDGIIMNYALQEYMKTPTFDILGDKRLVKQLRTKCRNAKESLSFTATSVNIHLDIDRNAHLDLNVQLTKIKLNELCGELYTRTFNLIDDTLKMANFKTDYIDHVILVGGSTRIPAIKSILEMKFGQKKLKFNIHPDEAVVFGAAILADAIEKEKQIPLINNPMNELTRNINNVQIGGDNSFDNSRTMLFYHYYQNNNKNEERICLFGPFTCSVEKIAKFHNCYQPYEVATTQDKIFGINLFEKSFEIYDLSTRQISGGPDPPEWRAFATVAYFKDKLYYLSGNNPETCEWTNRVDVLIDGSWELGPDFPLPIAFAQTITCNGILYVIDDGSRKIYRLSDDEWEWIEIGEIPEERSFFGVASLNGRIYITGGLDNVGDALKSCLCFNPLAPVDSQISRIADLNYERHHHSLVAANGKLYAIGGYQDGSTKEFCNSTEEYDPQTNKWREVRTLFYLYYQNNNVEDEERICLFNSYSCSVEEISKFNNYYKPYEVATTQNEIFGIDGRSRSFEIYDLNTQQISRGPDPPEWRAFATVAYFKDKLYYLGGWDPKTRNYTNRVDVLIDEEWQTEPTFPLPIRSAQTITCDQILYVIDGLDSNKIYRLSDNEREWIEIVKIPERRVFIGLASLNGRIYITGGLDGDDVLKSCLCFDPSAPADSRVSQIAGMNYARCRHSLVVSNRKLYAIGGFQRHRADFCNSIEEYDPQANEWREVGTLKLK